MYTKITANFRDVEPQQTCVNCGNVGHKIGDKRFWSEGYDGCLKINEIVFCCDKHKSVCDLWKPKYVPTEKDKALAKISKKDRKLLGLE